MIPASPRHSPTIPDEEPSLDQDDRRHEFLRGDEAVPTQNFRDRQTIIALRPTQTAHCVASGVADPEMPAEKRVVRGRWTEEDWLWFWYYTFPMRPLRAVKVDRPRVQWRWVALAIAALAAAMTLSTVLRSF